MAFTQDTFAPIAQNSTKAPRSWSYQTDDDFATVLTPGYFSDKKFQLETTDFIWVVASDAQRIIRYAGEDEEPEIIAPKPPINVLVASSLDDQEPSALDTPMQIKFGAAQGTVDDPIMIDSDGSLTFNVGGVFDVNVTVNVGRLGAPAQVANIFARGLINNVQFGNPIATLIDNPDIIIPEQFSITGLAETGDVVKFEILRDSSGINEGGLLAQPSSVDWGVAPSAVMRVLRFI